MTARLVQFTARKPLQRDFHAATQHSMRGRFTSLFVLIGLLFGIVVMPNLAHAAISGSGHGSEMLTVEEVGEADHSHSQGSDKDMPCHAVSHHHCSTALHHDAPHINLSALSKDMLGRPAATTPLASRSQAPPLDPPLA